MGTLRLKIVEFLSVLVRAVVTTQPALTEPLQVELLRLDALYSCLNLFFEVSPQRAHTPTRGCLRVCVERELPHLGIPPPAATRQLHSLSVYVARLTGVSCLGGGVGRR